MKFNIDPVPASRPKVTRYATYYGKKYTQFREDMKLLISQQDITLVKGLVHVDVFFIVPMPKSWSKKKKNKHRGEFCGNVSDLDNYLKAIFDSLNGVAFDDDRYIISVFACKTWDDDGSIDVKVYEKGDN